MSEIEYTIKPEYIEWEMDWSKTWPDGSRLYPDKPEKEMIFNEEPALAHLLINEVIFLNSHHWEKDWPEAARKATSLNVNCNDIFAWGCADAEEISVDGDDLKKLYFMWKREPVWGPALWCMIQRREMPQAPVAESMRKAGIFLDDFQAEHNLRENFGVGLSRALKEAGVVEWTDPQWKIVRAQFIKDNGWEGEAK